MKNSDEKNKSKKNESNLFKNTLIFAVSNIATKIIAFILIPIYTRAMTTEEYGVSDLLYTIGTVVVPLFTFNISEAVYRFLMDKDADEEKIISNALKILISGSMISIPIILLVTYFTPYRQYSIIYTSYIISTMFFQVLSMNLRGKRKLKRFAMSNILNIILVVIMSSLFVYILKWNIYGFFLSYVVSNTVSAIYASRNEKILEPFKDKQFSHKLLKDMVKYSIVLVPTTFMWWIINSSDKVMISWIVGESANGIYSVSSRIPMILTTIAGIFNQAWVFTAVDKSGSADEEKYVNKIFHTMYVAIFFIAIFFSIILKPFLSIYVDPDFFEAWKFVPPLLIGSAFVSMGTFLSVSYNVHKDSKGFLFSGLFGAIINIVLNGILIPIIGIYGAAIATLISYITVFIYRIFDTKKYVKIIFQWKNLVPVALLGLCCALLYIDNWQISLPLQLFLCVIYLLCYRRDLFRLGNKVLIKVQSILHCP